MTGGSVWLTGHGWGALFAILNIFQYMLTAPACSTKKYNSYLYHQLGEAPYNYLDTSLINLDISVRVDTNQLGNPVIFSVETLDWGRNPVAI